MSKSIQQALADALERGAKSHEQQYTNVYFVWEDEGTCKACANGAVFVGLGGNLCAYGQPYYPDLRSFVRHELEKIGVDASDWYRLHDALAYRNDYLKQSFAEIIADLRAGNVKPLTSDERLDWDTDAAQWKDDEDSDWEEDYE